MFSQQFLPIWHTPQAPRRCNAAKGSLPPPLPGGYFSSTPREVTFSSPPMAYYQDVLQGRFQWFFSLDRWSRVIVTHREYEFPTELVV